MMCLLTSIPCFSAILNSLRLMYHRQPITFNNPKPPPPPPLALRKEPTGERGNPKLTWIPHTSPTRQRGNTANSLVGASG